ncbi:MAG: hypothetical protein HY655_07880 [Acidobacteria bacterium]|nr:hypothetical protein [Acidobacteriota bacterium]
MLDDLGRLTDEVLRLLAEGQRVDAPVLTFLIRRYRAANRADLRKILESALADALDRPFPTLPIAERAAYLTAFVEALGVADDDRIRAAVEGLLVSLRRDWAVTTRVEDCAASLDACLAAAAVVDPRAIVPDAIDELERVIGGAYRPGDGLAHDLLAGGARGRLGDHLRCSAALLTAYRITARIPYGMLAEELMQFAHRTLWDDDAGAFAAASGARDHPFALNCAAAGVYCALAALHQEEDYRAAAVISAGADYRGDAERILASQSESVPPLALECALYGLALEEWLGGS